MRTLTFDPQVSASLWVALAAIAGASLVWYSLRRPGSVTPGRWAAIVVLMATSIALVLLILLNPTWVEPVPPPAGKPLLTLLLDTTASMASPDASGKRTRYEAAADLARGLADKLSPRFDVRLLTFDERVAPAPPGRLALIRPDGDRTNLAAAIAGGLDEARPQGQAVVLLSDGIQTAEGTGGAAGVTAAARQARALGAPVFTRTFGGVHHSTDLAVEMRNPQELAFTGQSVDIRAIVAHRGLDGASVGVALLQDGKEIARQAASLTTAGAVEARFPLTAGTRGIYRYEVRADSWPGELTLANNLATCVLRVVDEPVRVLLLEGKPYWDAKFLLRTLAFDPAVELDGVVRMAEGRLIRRTLSPHPAVSHAAPAAKGAANAATQPAPQQETWSILSDPSKLLADPEALKPYQIIVLGRDAEVFLTDDATANLRTWVARSGGALICYRGSPVAEVNQRLAALMPVRWATGGSGQETRFRLRLTGAGQEQAWLGGVAPGMGAEGAPSPGRTGNPSTEDGPGLSQLPPLAMGAAVGGVKPLSVVLAYAGSARGSEAGAASSGDSPVVTYQPYGSGRVVVIEGAGMWRWAFLPPQRQEEEGIYSDLWQRMMRWLSAGSGLLPNQAVSLRTDKVTFAVSEPATATLLLREESAGGATPFVRLTQEDAANVPNSAATAPAAASPRAASYSPMPMGEGPGAFRVLFGPLPEGRYRATVEGFDQQPAAVAAFDVRRSGREHLDLDAREDLMAQVAQESGGDVLGDDPAGQIVRGFDQMQAAAARARAPRRVVAWDRWWVLAGAITLWGVSWAMRRSSGLI